MEKLTNPLHLLIFSFCDVDTGINAAEVSKKWLALWKHNSVLDTIYLIKILGKLSPSLNDPNIPQNRSVGHYDPLTPQQMHDNRYAWQSSMRVIALLDAVISKIDNAIIYQEIVNRDRNEDKLQQWLNG